MAASRLRSSLRLRLFWVGSASSAFRTADITYRAHRMPIGAAKRWATALENDRVRVAVALWRLYFGTGHWLDDFLIARMTGSGRCRVLRQTSSTPLC